MFADVESLRLGRFIHPQTNGPAQHAQQTPRDHPGKSCGIDCSEALGHQLGSDIELAESSHGSRAEDRYQHGPHDPADAMHAEYVQ